MKCWISESMGSRFWLPLPWKVYMYVLCVGSGLFSKLGAYRNAVGVARKHFVNWPELVVSAFLGRGGVYRSRGGGEVSCDAKTLLRRFVRMEYVWRLHGDTLPTVRFEDDSMVIPNYFECLHKVAYTFVFCYASNPENRF